MHDGPISAVTDWSFAGDHPLSELLTGIKCGTV